MSERNIAPLPLDAGVIGVGSMGSNHARIYAELYEVDLVGVADVDEQQARKVAAEHNTETMPRAELLEAVDIVSVAVPTRFHDEIVRECIDAGVHVLVEKPFVRNVECGRELGRLADREDLVLQVGHIERFNPATQVGLEIMPDLDVTALTTHRLGPPVDRDSNDDVVLDLMIHDIDIVLALVGNDPVASVSASGAANGEYVIATVEFESGIVADLTASRVTQQKVRDLAITATECRVAVDYLTQDVEIHRNSMPEFVTDEQTFKYRHEGVIERPIVENTEPLKAELSSFVEAVVTGTEPKVTAADGVRAIELARRIKALARTNEKRAAVLEDTVLGEND
ncbi:Gfo/Idh/MocA family oxidoreductase [Haloarchaeobius sp. DFWS5]|uniref:Gfo/Idh/MocA family oxidoreductase n=1 Tax=Haloarchaeobius sp. DFWS5 TaxID=3446114 RepID=UPI003EBDE104